MIACGLCLAQRRIEPAGRSFHAVHEKPKLEGKRRGRGAQGKGDAEDSDDEQEAAGNAAWKKKKKEGGFKKGGTLKLSHLLEGVDLYALLEVTESASVEQIKKQYRKLVLQHHPDKQNGAEVKTDKAEVADKAVAGLGAKEQLFIKIQEAYEVLSDPTKRRQYDSTLDFDDDIPDEADESIGFYATFRPVFQRNARFSCRHPVPELGDEKTDIAKVHKFIDFWYNFETWREFSHHDEFNPDDAEFREERRWMERQNQKMRKKLQDGERRRIIRLVENAERLDPRLRAEREEIQAKKREEKERRARLKQEEQDEKLREAEEKKKQEEREQAEREEKERLEREERKQKAQLAKKGRQRAKKAMQSRCKLNAAEEEDFQEFCLALDADALEALCQRMEKLPTKQKDAEAKVREELAAWKKKQEGDKEEQAKQREEAKQREKQQANEAKGAASGTAWAVEEMGFLAKGLQKFPGGIGGRWGLIAQFLTQNGFERTEREVIEKTKEMSDGQSLRAMGAQLASDLSAYKAPKAAGAKAAAKAAGYPKAIGANAAAAAAASAASVPKAASPKAASQPAEPQAVSAEWSAEQQKALETALQKHPASLDKNERWRLIAEDVPGKTKSQCVERFKFLREQLAKQK